MPLTPGARFGPYEIAAPLGAGGMGEVYRARDTRLGRDVAIKVLPAELAGSPELRARLEREARTISSLNHPHICVLHDVGREDDTDYLVMELIEGETLAARLARGALPAADVQKLGGQIADALDRAHRAGVVHRDLKPGNVMLTRAGVKLMDFGLARTTGMPGGAQAGLTESPTLSRPLTAEGTIVGTFQYLAPEQLEGKEADARSDLWALGCVLYEMATGRRAFEGRSQASLIGAILHTEPPPISQAAPLSPPALDRLVTACLAKDPADRIQSAHDVKLQLAWMVEGATSSAGLPAPLTPRARRLPRWIAYAALVAVTAVATALVVSRMPRGGTAAPGAGGAQRYVLGTTELQPQSAPMISPDGSYIVFSVRDGGTCRLYRRSLDSFQMTPIAGTEDGRAPFFSPDGAWIGFVTPQAIRKVPAGGGVAQTILPEPRVNSADWGRDGAIYFTPRFGGADGLTALSRVPEGGGKAEVVAALDTAAAEREAWLPEILPDGRTVLLTIVKGGTWRIVALRPDGSRHTVVDNALLGRYTRAGRLVYYAVDSEAVFAAPFDPGKAMLTGPAVPLTEPVDANYCHDVSETGQLAYVPQPGAGEGDEIVWLDRRGAARPAMDTRGPWAQPRISPDGRRVLLRKVAPGCELWMLDVERGSLARFVQGNDNHDAIWSPDGGRIAFGRADAPGEMVTLTTGGARQVTTLAQGAATGRPQSWSAGGNLLVYTVTGRGTQGDIWVRSMDGASPATAFLATPFNEEDPSISSDGRWIAHVSNETGTPEVFVRPYPDTGVAWQISAGGGAGPLWSRDGRELFFLSGSRMMAVPVETRPTFRAGAPVVLFEGGFRTTRARDFDVASDGRFVAVRGAGGIRGGQELRMLLNWEDETRRVGGVRH